MAALSAKFVLTTGNVSRICTVNGDTHLELWDGITEITTCYAKSNGISVESIQQDVYRCDKAA